MPGKTKLEFENNNKIFYEREVELKGSKREAYIIFITVVILIISLIVCLLQNYKWKPLRTLYIYKRIKKNMNSWGNIIKEKVAIEKQKAQLIIATKPEYGSLQILDFGSYYSVGRLNSQGLPEFIQRGTSGPWRISKKDTGLDIGAYQFATYIKDVYRGNIIACGDEMFKNLGFSGYFIKNSPCELALEIMGKKRQ
ncbi:putative entry/fusion membrane protein [Diachasmimorpha longicaudata entomopoxvirus]|uniref:Putative entry/fusion membrane protein n=1 Tax=Diachasmimorpha longicaudata entomopoxvirus TaxID=109981 RepID=A0A7R5WU63_9POXV|nr:putative entry/fusion membrane protein [Diachasmimorpha longicaudata entomopoxvirus]AKS26357.1 putative entry/fusion membrane protein [Diachasmimorpha longicaudata entomopoxvirus]